LPCFPPSPGLAQTETADAIRICQELMPAFEEAAAALRIELQKGGVGQPTGVRLSWWRDGAEGWIICWFLPRASDEARWQLSHLDTSRFGRMSRYDIQQLYKLIHLQRTYRPQDFGPPGTAPVVTALYVLQQAINGISLGCVYGLIALGYTLVFGITRVINFAFGEIYMIGAFVTFVAYAVVTASGGTAAPTALLAIPVAVVATSASLGWTTDRLMFRPMRQSPVTAVMIATIGLSLFLKDSARLLQGARTKYLLIEEFSSWRIVSGLGFDVYLSKGHAAIAVLTAAIGALLWWLNGRTRFGRSQRACAQDIGMAALLGVDIDRTIRLTIVLGSAIVGAAGLFAAGQYGVINFHMGTLMGFKALTAALLGGIGSLPGAVLGGFIIALTEVFTAAFAGSGWKDLAVFAVLVAVLLFRPAGLLGTTARPAPGERP
jgi:branched-chain amino acid transport system permease protein